MPHRSDDAPFLSASFVERVTTDDAPEPPVIAAGALACPTCQRLRAALGLLVGSADVKELRGMAAAIASLPISADDKAAMLYAIDVLCETTRP